MCHNSVRLAYIVFIVSGVKNLFVRYFFESSSCYPEKEGVVNHCAPKR